MHYIKKNLKQIYIMMTALLVVASLIPITVQASTKNQVSKLVSTLDNFIYYNIETHFNVFQQNSIKNRKKYKVKMNKQNMMSAAALSTKFYKNESLEKHEDSEGGYEIFKLSPVKLKRRCKDLFGKTGTVSDLSEQKNEHSICYAFKKSGYPCVYLGYYETETDFVHKSLSIKKTSNKTYMVKEKLYFGHWDIFQTSAPNYEVTFKIKNNDSSSFGYVVKDINIKWIGEI